MYSCLGINYNTTINANGHSVTFHNGGFGMSGMGMCGYSPGCFGYGYNSMCYDPMIMGAGIGLGQVLGGALPGIVKGVGKGCSWLWENAIKPGASWAWDSVIKPGAEIAWKGIKAAGKGIVNGVKTLWNKLFVD